MINPQKPVEIINKQRLSGPEDVIEVHSFELRVAPMPDYVEETVGEVIGDE